MEKEPTNPLKERRSHGRFPFPRRHKSLSKHVFSLPPGFILLSFLLFLVPRARLQKEENRKEEPLVSAGKKAGNRCMSPKTRLGDEERRLMHLVPAPAVRLMKRRVLSRPGVNSLMVLLFRTPGQIHSSFHSSIRTSRATMWKGEEDQ